MKANELMIGDWVLIKTDTTNVARVEEIYPNGVITIDGRTSLEDEIFPIPLTPEILEKSGWNKWQMYYRLGIGEMQYMEYYQHESRVQRIYIHKDNRREICFTISGISYVHTLQHALRLCGIEKEIIVKEDKQ